ncbi:GNAT family protein [Klebsiella michiganensis]|uniref:GNAT family N-acetyltransferase n=1 Tax=Klebsiella michiganensis TaxID=1134687 RepID=UPI0032DB5C36
MENHSIVPFVVKDKDTDTPTGVICFAEIDLINGSIELGHITWSRLMQKTPVGTEAIYLLLRYAFSLGFRHIVWRCDALNDLSRRAALRLGFSYEGCFIQAMTNKQRNRDTAWFSMLDKEWP